jgi:hypothetical protein
MSPDLSGNWREALDFCRELLLSIRNSMGAHEAAESFRFGKCLPGRAQLVVIGVSMAGRIRKAA